MPSAASNQRELASQSSCRRVSRGMSPRPRTRRNRKRRRPVARAHMPAISITVPMTTTSIERQSIECR